jgi:hypothetical protein
VANVIVRIVAAIHLYFIPTLYSRTSFAHFISVTIVSTIPGWIPATSKSLTRLRQHQADKRLN